MKKTKLAEVLGISRQMIYKLYYQGMPIDSVDAAIQWRKKHLNPCKTKVYRIRLLNARERIMREWAERRL